MRSPFSELQPPVRRRQAETHLFTMLVCFGLSVALTRLFLELSGYPQIGNAELHIAHVLWGGLLQFVALMVLLMFANPWVYPLGAILGGVGIGLFIDEVGKFITQSNDYFYPWAAPIIYAFFLLTVMVYLRFSRQQQRDPRTEMYHALHLLIEVLDHDLDPDERVGLVGHLQAAGEDTTHSDLKVLSQSLLKFVQREDLHLAPEKPDFWQRWEKRWDEFEERILGQKRFQWLLILGMAVLAVVALLELGIVIRGRFSPEILTGPLTNLVLGGQVKGLPGVRWFTVFVSLNGSIGLLLVAAIVLSLLGKQKNGLSYGYFGLLLQLTAANLLAFYFNQFSTIILAVVQLVLLVGILRYRQRYLVCAQAASTGQET